MVFPSGPDADLPTPDPFWLTLLATLCGLVVPAATAIGAVVLLGPPSIPHTSRLATIAAGALTLPGAAGRDVSPGSAPRSVVLSGCPARSASGLGSRPSSCEVPASR
jgi:hypothetical protein